MGNGATFYTASAKKRKKKKRVAPGQPDSIGDRAGRLSVAASVRFRVDSNIYRSPSEPYVDLSQVTQPTITPAVQSGNFAPVDITVEYLLHGHHGTNYLLSYKLDGDFYLDPLFDNANEVSHVVKIGSDTLLGVNGGSTTGLPSAGTCFLVTTTMIRPHCGCVPCSVRISVFAPICRLPRAATITPTPSPSMSRSAGQRPSIQQPPRPSRSFSSPGGSRFGVSSGSMTSHRAIFVANTIAKR